MHDYTSGPSWRGHAALALVDTIVHDIFLSFLTFPGRVTSLGRSGIARVHWPLICSSGSKVLQRGEAAYTALIGSLKNEVLVAPLDMPLPCSGKAHGMLLD